MRLFIAMAGADLLARDLADRLHGQSLIAEDRRFPDGESYVRLSPAVKGKDVLLVCQLSPPDAALLPLVFAARTARALGARSVKLVAPYLPYLRQDRIFEPGEALSSAIFANLISREVDALITVDPHLHRYPSLETIYSIPATVVHSSGLIAAWIRDNVESPVIIGPDSESAQWVSDVARSADAPWACFEKKRLGDRKVELIGPDLERWRDRTPVVVDDIAASGETMIAALEHLVQVDLKAPYCIAIHGLFDEDTGNRIARLAKRLITTDTVPNKYNSLAVAPLIAQVLAAQGC